MALSDHSDDIAHLYFNESQSYQQIGDRYGKSREAVRQFLDRHFPGRVPGTVFRKEQNEQKRTAAEVERRAAVLAEAPACVICGDPVLRKVRGKGSRFACNSFHSALWARGRFLLDDEMRLRQRDSTARSILKYPDQAPPRRVLWAEKVLSGEAPAGHRAAPRNSAARRAYEEVMHIRDAKGWTP